MCMVVNLFSHVCPICTLISFITWKPLGKGWASAPSQRWGTGGQEGKAILIRQLLQLLNISKSTKSGDMVGGYGLLY